MTGVRDRLADSSLVVGAGLVTLFAVLIVAHSVVLIAGGTVQPAVTVGVAVLVAAGVWFALRTQPVRARALSVGVFTVLIAISLAVAALSIDLSWDGNQYHKVAAATLGNGWNPVWQSGLDWNESAANPTYLEDEYARWNDFYTKATPLFGASLYQLTGHIETGKAFNLLAIFAVFLITAGYLARRIRPWQAITVAALAALNPVAVSQMFTYYVDGLVGNLILITIVLLSMLIDPDWHATAPWRTAYWVTLVSTFVVLANVKFTGLLYAGLFGLLYLIVLATRWRTAHRRFWQLTTAGAIAGVIAVFVVGASSYVRNTITQGNPLHPLIGPDAVDIITWNQPPEFIRMNAINRFVVANLSTSENDIRDIQADLKVPFTFTAEEVRVFEAFDVRIGGYGVWFGGILLLSLALGIYLLVRHHRQRSLLPLYLLPLAGTLIGILATEGSWWARYTPHLVLLPLLVLTALFATGARVLPWLLAAALTINVAAIGLIQTRQQQAILQNPSIADVAHDLGDCITFYPASYVQDTMDGTVFNVLEAVPDARLLTTDEFHALPEDAFRVYWMVYAHVMITADDCDAVASRTSS